MKGLGVYFIACLVMLATASGAFALHECAGDIARFCSNIPEGKGYIADCLSQNEAQLSQECKSLHLSELAEAMRQAQRACETDTVKFCASEQMQSQASYISCMWGFRTSISPDCNRKLTHALEMIHY